MTAVMVPLHFKQASNDLIEELLQSKVIRRVKILPRQSFNLELLWSKNLVALKPA